MANTEARRRPFKCFLGVDENGDHTVFSTTEPAFCFVRKSEAEAIAAAENTWRDYVARFGYPMEHRRAAANVTLHQIKTTRELEVAY